MKTLIGFTTLALACATGCSTVSLMHRPGPTLIAQPPGATVYAYRDGSKGDSVGVIRAGDTVRSMAGRSGRDVLLGRRYGDYLVPFGNDSGFVAWPQVKEDWELEPSTFSLPAADDKDAWARANYYVGEHATMKIQTATDFRIETFNPIDADDRSFAVTRLPQGDHVTYTVTVHGDDAEMYQGLCARFIRTGK